MSNAPVGQSGEANKNTWALPTLGALFVLLALVWLFSPDGSESVPSGTAGASPTAVSAGSATASAVASPTPVADETDVPSDDGGSDDGGSGDGSSDIVGIDPVSQLAWVASVDLPPIAQETLQLIDDGGPFPYVQDGSTFGNREGVLPAKPRGYYAEYTVRKPGEDDRGPWRLVVGDQGEIYWTVDHYRSFERVAR